MAKIILYRLMVLMIGSLLTISAFSQLQLKVVVIGPEPPLPKNFAYASSFRSRQQLQDYLQQLPVLLQANGYLAASVDSIAEKDNVTTAFLFTGSQYQWGAVTIDQADWPLLHELGYSMASFGIADARLIQSLPEKIVDYFQNNGYPFAKVKWDSVALQDDKIMAALKIIKGPLYKMDSLGLYGSAKISKAFLFKYLNLPQDGLYRKNVLDGIDTKLTQLTYLQQLQPWNISMQSTGYVLNFYLQPKRSNMVDALIGFLPSNQQNGGKLLLTVDAHLQLRNAFGSGEGIDFNWEQIQPQSPRLQLAYQQPYIFHSGFGADFAFNLYKKDSSFLNVNGSLGLQYQLASHQSARVIFQTQTTHLLDVDTNNIRFTKTLPDIADINNIGLGVEYTYRNTDHRFNPSTGTEWSVSVMSSKKTIRKNNAITQIKDGSFNYNQLYDSVQLKSYQLKLQLQAAHYFRLAKQSVIKTSLQAGWLQTPDFFRNEMFQLGGYRLLRGFDEESIFASRYAVTTLEYRYLVGPLSFFYVFTDIGYSRFQHLKTVLSHGYVGAGGGLAFETRQGIFNIGYAAGKRDDLRFNLRQSKIHLGYSSFF